MTLATATVDLVRMPTRQARTWHILAIPDETVTLCAWAVPEGATVERDFDPHVISHRGKPVCSRCRGRLT